MKYSVVYSLYNDIWRKATSFDMDESFKFEKKKHFKNKSLKSESKTMFVTNDDLKYTMDICLKTAPVLRIFRFFI